MIDLVKLNRKSQKKHIDKKIDIAAFERKLLIYVFLDAVFSLIRFWLIGIKRPCKCSKCIGMLPAVFITCYQGHKVNIIKWYLNADSAQEGILLFIYCCSRIHFHFLEYFLICRLG